MAGIVLMGCMCGGLVISSFMSSQIYHSIPSGAHRLVACCLLIGVLVMSGCCQSKHPEFPTDAAIGWGVLAGLIVGLPWSFFNDWDDESERTRLADSQTETQREQKREDARFQRLVQQRATQLIADQSAQNFLRRSPRLHRRK